MSSKPLHLVSLKPALMSLFLLVLLTVVIGMRGECSDTVRVTCCMQDGSCFVTDLEDCREGIEVNFCVQCEDALAAAEEGACCLFLDQCIMTANEEECMSMGGIEFSNAALCQNGACDSGSCCKEDECLDLVARIGCREGSFSLQPCAEIDCN